ncbi:hypothetical protein GCM10007928_44930 [Sulfitobacter porphyrae]|nr:hypothetical protein GCM10007928_44930 [Sulfitobacter porphyrae]
MGFSGVAISLPPPFRRSVAVAGETGPDGPAALGKGGETLSMAETKCASFPTAPGSLAIRFAPDPAPQGGCEIPTSQDAANYGKMEMPRQMEGRPRCRVRTCR